MSSFSTGCSPVYVFTSFSKVALVAFGSFVMMITLFLYILFLIYRRDEQPHVCELYHVSPCLKKLMARVLFNSGELGVNLAPCQR
jgi:hypothetical protein